MIVSPDAVQHLAIGVDPHIDVGHDDVVKVTSLLPIFIIMFDLLQV